MKNFSYELAALTTESANERTENIDELSTLAMLELINAEDCRVPLAVGKILPQIAAAIEVIVAKIQQGGRIIYLGAGTSGRLGVLDAVECPPTFGTSPELVQGIIAGGNGAMFKAKEGAEDDFFLAEEDLKAIHFTTADVLVGIAASGRTPYVIGGLKYARRLGAVTVGLACGENPTLGEYADILLNPITGAEVVSGSTRLKAGTAQKMVLNMLSTGTMIKLGKVYGNLMVDVRATNAKLRERAIRIVMTAGECSVECAADFLNRAGGSAKLAILMAKTSTDTDTAAKLLQDAGGNLRRALAGVSAKK